MVDKTGTGDMAMTVQRVAKDNLEGEKRKLHYQKEEKKPKKQIVSMDVRMP